VAAACDAATVEIAQLHGDSARDALGELPARYRGIYCLSARVDGSLLTAMPGEARMEAAAPMLLAGAQGWRKPVNWLSRGRRTVDFLLVDGADPGSGQPVDWARLRVSRGAARKGWLLAGGLTAENVAAALSAARPDGVDVASGVAGPDGVRKDPAKVAAFCSAVADWHAARHASAPSGLAHS
jgi:phosphoribosylanthranilate isomerase